MAGAAWCPGGLCVSATRRPVLLAIILASLLQRCCPVAAARPPSSPRALKSPPPSPPPPSKPVQSPPTPPPLRPPLPPPSPPTILSLKGKVIFKNTHTRLIWTLSTGSAVYKLPQQPADAATGQPIEPLTSISLKCTLAADEPLRCAAISEVRVTVLAAPLPAAGQTLRLLVLVVSLTATTDCDARAGASVSAVRDAYLSTNGYVDFLGSCSYGRMVYDTSKLTVLGVSVPCSAAILRCDEDAIATAARRVASTSVSLSSFSHFAYVIPTGLVNTCGWVGLAELPGSQTWFTPDNYGIFDKGTLLQETLHNFGLYHGWRDGVEYADRSSCMGSGESCPSGPELWRLGWATTPSSSSSSSPPSSSSSSVNAVDNSQQLFNSSSLLPRLFRRLVLPATYVGPERAVLRIQPDWLGQAAYTKNVYLALRMRAGGDRDLLPEFDQKINVHELDKNIDNTPGARGDPRVTILGTIPAWNSRDLPSYKLFIRTEALTGSTMVVKVCRYVNGPSECSDGANTSPSPPPPSSPPQRSPPLPLRPTVTRPPPVPRRSPPPPPRPPLRSPPSPRKIKPPPPPPPDDYYYAPPPYWGPPPYFY